jgi:hypothetical protein
MEGYGRKWRCETSQHLDFEHKLKQRNSVFISVLHFTDKETKHENYCFS